jgi:hypothetical protein
VFRELKQLVDKSGYTTLSAILGAVLVEARGRASTSHTLTRQPNVRGLFTGPSAEACATLSMPRASPEATT